MNHVEQQILNALDTILREDAVRATIDPIVSQVEQELARSAAPLMAWQPIPLPVYCGDLPRCIQSSWVFILRAGVTTGAERHPNSHQRVMSYRGSGDLQVQIDNTWRSNELVSDPQLPVLRRWASIPENVWHQAVVPQQNWVVVSFHTVPAQDLVEERPDGKALRQRHYLSEGRVSVS